MKTLQILLLIFGLSIFTNAQIKDESLLQLKGRIIYQRVDTDSVVKISFQNKEREYQTKIDDNNFFEINIPKGSYQVAIIVTNGGSDEYQFKNVKIVDSEPITFDTKRADSLLVACPIITPDVFVETNDAKPSNDIKLIPLRELPEAQNKTIKRKRKN